MKSRRFWIALFAFILTVVLLFQYRFPIAERLGRFLVKKDPIEKCEVIFAPWSRLRSNFVYAIRMVKEGWGDHLVVTSPKASAVEKEFRKTYGLEDRVACIKSMGLDMAKILKGIKEPDDIIAHFATCAKEAIESGAEVIIPTTTILDIILSKNKVNEIDGCPVLPSVTTLVKTTEAMVELRKAGIMIEVQYTTDLAAINSDTFTQGGLSDALISHTLIYSKFHCNLCRKRNGFLAFLGF